MFKVGSMSYMECMCSPNVCVCVCVIIWDAPECVCVIILVAPECVYMCYYLGCTRMCV